MAHRALVLLARCWPCVLALAVLWPVLAPGFVLTYDMVFVPDLALRPDFLGLGSGLPRAVPSDAVVAVLDEVLPGMVLQKVLLFAALLLAGYGAARLVPSDASVGRVAATTFYVWSPLVAERLVIGHWPLLLTYAALPWLFVSVRRLRSGRSGYAPVALWLALGSLSPAGGVLAGAFALVAATGDREPVRRLVGVGGLVLAVNAPWLVAGLLHGGSALSDPSAVELFAARGEAGMPAWLTVLGLGGIWNAEAVPASRTGWPAWAALGLLVALASAGAHRCLARGAGAGAGASSRSDGRVALAGSALLGVVVALAASVVPGAVGALVQHVPGAGLLRDSTRALVLVAPLLTVLVAQGVVAVTGWLGRSPAGTVLVTALVLAPIALLPDLAGGVAGRMAPVGYPDEYSAARAALAERVREREGAADLLVLPFSSYRLPEWNGGRRTLDPLGRFMTPDYLASDTLFVSGEEVEGEDLRARRVHRLLERAAPGAASEEVVDALRAEGVGWVLLDHAAEAQLGDRVPSGDFSTQPVVHQGENLVVWELQGTVRGDSEPVAARLALALGWLAWLSTLVAAVAAVIRRGVADAAGTRRRRAREGQVIT